VLLKAAPVDLLLHKVNKHMMLTMTKCIPVALLANGKCRA